jgi:hypothetical protein
MYCPYALVERIGSYSYYDLNNPIPDIGVSIFENQRHDLLETITDIYRDGKNADWDNEGALPISSKTWNMAEKFINTLPFSNCKANAFATQNGKIGIQWLIKTGAALSILIEGTGNITYAAIFQDGTNKNGYEIFSGTLPGDIRESLLQICKSN